MEHPPFMDDFLIETSIYMGFPAMFDDTGGYTSRTWKVEDSARPQRLRNEVQLER